MRVQILAVLATLALAAPAHAQPSSGQTVGEIPYTTCDGSRWSVSWRGDDFFHRPETGSGHPDDHMDYRTWDGSCWSAKWMATTTSGVRCSHGRLSKPGTWIFSRARF